MDTLAAKTIASNSLPVIYCRPCRRFGGAPLGRAEAALGMYGYRFLLHQGSRRIVVAHRGGLSSIVARRRRPGLWLSPFDAADHRHIGDFLISAPSKILRLIDLPASKHPRKDRP